MNAYQIGLRLGATVKQATATKPFQEVPGPVDSVRDALPAVGKLLNRHVAQPAQRGYGWVAGRVNEAAKAWPEVRDAVKNPLDTLTTVVHGGMNRAIGPSAPPTAYYRPPK